MCSVHVSPTRDTRGPRGSGLDHGVPSVTLEHDLTTIADLANIRPANLSFLLAPELAKADHRPQEKKKLL